MLGKVCTKPVLTASAQMTVAQAASAMRSKNVGALVVVNAGRPIGMLTDRDIVMDVVALGVDPDSVRGGDVMHKKLVVIQDHLGILDAAQAFAKSGVRQLPVVLLLQQGKRLRGLLGRQRHVALLARSISLTDQGIGFVDDPRCLDLLTARSLDILFASRRLNFLAPGRLDLLASRRLHVLTARRLHVLAAGSLHVLTPRGLHVLAAWSLDVLPPRRLNILRPGAGLGARCLYLLALRCLAPFLERCLCALQGRFRLSQLRWTGVSPPPAHGRGESEQGNTDSNREQLSHTCLHWVRTCSARIAAFAAYSGRCPVGSGSRRYGTGTNWTEGRACRGCG